jgi:F-type H+-transporting ATPase subunit epsilon
MATSKTLHVEVVTAEQEMYSGEADMVSAPGVAGRLGILPEHAPLITVLSPGALRITLGGAEETLFVSGGFLEVSSDNVTVLADAAEHADDIDEARAEEARRRAEERLQQATSDSDRAEIQARLQRELIRLRVAEMARQSGNRRRINRPTRESEQQ